jgi:DNA-binding XRE family transcriptional regulator
MARNSRAVKQDRSCGHDLLRWPRVLQLSCVRGGDQRLVRLACLTREYKSSVGSQVKGPARTQRGEWTPAPLDRMGIRPRINQPSRPSVQDCGPGSLAPGLRSRDQACFSLVPPLDQPDQRLAAAIRALRDAQGITQEDVAYAAGMTTSSYSRLERGRTNPAWTTVQRVADGLGITIVQLAQAVEREEG